MESLSVIIPTCNNAAVLPAALRSVEAAVATLRAGGGPCAGAPVEVVVVDDGSTDETGAVLGDMTAGKDLYRVVRRARPSSPGCARNTGVEASRGSLLFFLDADDLYFPDHLHACATILTKYPNVQLVKTGVRLADPVHADWRSRIEDSVALNLCLRRPCHFAIGGFPDYHLFLRRGDDFRQVVDLFYKFEDQYYNMLLLALFASARLGRETVQYVRYPGNSYDRQYAKFCRPFAEAGEPPPEDYFRLKVCGLIVQERLNELRAARAAESPPPG